jgi:hypothetical protein
VRVPLMVVWPGVVEPGSKSGAVVGAIDVYPTILAMLGLKPNPEQTMDGVSIVPALKQAGVPARSALFTYFPHGNGAKEPGVTVRSGDWKLIRWFGAGPGGANAFELYDLGTDLGETNNLAASQPAKVKELDALIDAFLKETGALYPRPNPNYRPAAAAASAAASASAPAGVGSNAEAALDGWVPKSARVARRDGVMVVEADGKNPFLAMTRLKQTGPVTLRMRVRSGGGGAGKVQWRTADQEGFPATGQAVEFALPAGDAWGETRVALPVEGSLVHMRLYLPARDAPVEVDWIALEPAGGAPQRWEFEAR